MEKFYIEMEAKRAIIQQKRRNEKKETRTSWDCALCTVSADDIY